MPLPDSAKELIRGGALGHLVTNGHDGTPQVTCVWVAVDGDNLLTAHLNPGQRKLQNVRRDPRVVISFEGSELQPPGLKQYVAPTAGPRSRRAARPSCFRSSRTSISVPTSAFHRWTTRRPACGCGSR